MSQSRLADLPTKTFLFCRKIVKIFLKLCAECELKKGMPKKGIVVKPIVTKIKTNVVKSILSTSNHVRMDDYSRQDSAPAIDSVDFPKIGHANLLGVVMEADNGFYKISGRGTKRFFNVMPFTLWSTQDLKPKFLNCLEFTQPDATDMCSLKEDEKWCPSAAIHAKPARTL
jgi:hypothetical protein